MFIIYGKKVKTFTRGHAHFSKAFMVFELTHIVFELELLIPIKYLVAPNILKHFVELWKIHIASAINLRSYKNIWLATKFKTITEIENRNGKESEREREGETGR